MGVWERLTYDGTRRSIAMNKGRRRRYGLIASVLTALALGLWASEAQAQQPKVTVASVTVEKGKVGVVKVTLEGMPTPGLRDFQGKLTYNPGVANVQNISGLNGYNIAAFQIDNVKGEVRFIGFKLSGLITQGEFLQFDILAVGNAGEKSSLEISFVTNGFNTPTGYVAPTVISGQLTIVAPQALKADFSFEPAQPQVGQEVKFTDKSTGGGKIISWSWEFGDNTTSTQQNPTHRYANPGTYTVELTVKDDQGASSTASKQITVVRPGQLPPVAVHVFPHPARTSATFSYSLPDGTTEAFLYVFDLTGRQVFLAELVVTGTTFRWDLKDSQGRDLPNGPYYYFVQATVPDRGVATSGVRKLVITR